MLRFLGTTCAFLACIVLGAIIFNFILLMDAMDLPPVHPKTEETWNTWAKEFLDPLKFSQSSGREPTHYEILEIPNCSPDEDIKASRRQLARKYHPDKVEGDKKAQVAERMVKINQSFDFLLHNSNRCTYDFDIGCGIKHTEECLAKREREFEEKVKSAREQREQERQSTGAEWGRQRRERTATKKGPGSSEDTRNEAEGGMSSNYSKPFFQRLASSIRRLLRFLFRL
ncbi:uncharacterized protein F4807DRAFT_462496 [Annulohypoxylon truncatum]|uniref:uncharacterized protein n=1 Tax=Annulohypoxylon truncatum TaxID=327061 RepID=UPI0020074C6E|nr:uncharacterized protein F4807DRAFT_462496 [Annulohypoxylon truncatum]KAI1207693.1 hypothetical protein F4807DRAFT_462496 [Annulohypoxylon truncatum]